MFEPEPNINEKKYVLKQFRFVHDFMEVYYGLQKSAKEATNESVISFETELELATSWLVNYMELKEANLADLLGGFVKLLELVSADEWDDETPQRMIAGVGEIVKHIEVIVNDSE